MSQNRRHNAPEPGTRAHRVYMLGQLASQMQQAHDLNDRALAIHTAETMRQLLHDLTSELTPAGTPRTSTDTPA